MHYLSLSIYEGLLFVHWFLDIEILKVIKECDFLGVYNIHL